MIGSRERLRTTRAATARVQLAPDGRVRSVRGFAPKFGLGDVRVGDDVHDHVAFLFGVLPYEGAPLQLPAVQTGSGRFAHVWVTPAPHDGGCLVTFVDAHDESRYRTMLQQWHHTSERGGRSEVSPHRRDAVAILAIRLDDDLPEPVRGDVHRRIGSIVSARGGVPFRVATDGHAPLLCLFGLARRSHSDPDHTVRSALRTALHVSETESVRVGVTSGGLSFGGAGGDPDRPPVEGAALGRAASLATRASCGQVLTDRSVRVDVPRSILVRPDGSGECTFVVEGVRPRR